LHLSWLGCFNAQTSNLSDALRMPQPRPQRRYWAKTTGTMANN
jgi:hypothetical protein